jgi:hypothetical protein
MNSLRPDPWIFANPELMHHGTLALVSADLAAYEALCRHRGLKPPTEQRDERPEYKAVARDVHVAVTTYLASLASDPAAQTMTIADIYAVLEHQ